MLTPEELLRISEGAEAVAETLHNEIIADIVRRIMIRLGRGDEYILTAKDKWQIETLEQSGYLREDIIREISKQTRIESVKIREAFEGAGVKSFDYDSDIYRKAGILRGDVALEGSPQYLRMLQRAYRKTMGEWRNYTGTFADAAQQLFIRECDKAYTLVQSGALSYTEAVKRAVEAVAEGGVYVEYKDESGRVYHRDTIETATLRCVRTGISQACAEITDARMEEMDWDIILVSAHLGARVTEREDYTNHYWWQGKFYSRSGKDKRFPPFSVCGFGDVQGINGANCRHSYGPGDGENNPYQQFDSEENRKAYELQQRQRLLERRIRKTKRECMAWNAAKQNAPDNKTKDKMEAEYRQKAALLQKQNADYSDFCEENGLKKLNDRLHVAQWDRKQAAQASAAARSGEGKMASEQSEHYTRP